MHRRREFERRLQQRPNLYGYQFKVNYNSTMVSAVGALREQLVRYLGRDQCTLLGADCSAEPASSRPASRPRRCPPSAAAPVATVNFTRLAAGSSNATITEIVLTNLDGFAIPYTSDTASLSFNVCGQASVSGKVCKAV